MQNEGMWGALQSSTRGKGKDKDNLSIKQCYIVNSLNNTGSNKVAEKYLTVLCILLRVLIEANAGVNDEIRYFIGSESIHDPIELLPIFFYKNYK